MDESAEFRQTRLIFRVAGLRINFSDFKKIDLRTFFFHLTRTHKWLEKKILEESGSGPPLKSVSGYRIVMKTKNIIRSFILRVGLARFVK